MVDMNDILDKLAEITEQEQAPWRTTADKSTFSAAFGRTSVHISAKETSPGTDMTSYRLSVLNEQGIEIEFATARWGPSVTNVKLPVLVPLYTSAKRTALGVDERLEELLNEMDRVSGS